MDGCTLPCYTRSYRHLDHLCSLKSRSETMSDAGQRSCVTMFNFVLSSIFSALFLLFSVSPWRPDHPPISFTPDSIGRKRHSIPSVCPTPHRKPSHISEFFSHQKPAPPAMSTLSQKSRQTRPLLHDVTRLGAEPGDGYCFSFFFSAMFPALSPTSHIHHARGGKKFPEMRCNALLCDQPSLQTD